MLCLPVKGGASSRFGHTSSDFGKVAQKRSCFQTMVVVAPKMLAEPLVILWTPSKAMVSRHGSVDALVPLYLPTNARASFEKGFSIAGSQRQCFPFGCLSSPSHQKQFVSGQRWLVPWNASPSAPWPALKSACNLSDSGIQQF